MVLSIRYDGKNYTDLKELAHVIMETNPSFGGHIIYDWLDNSWLIGDLFESIAYYDFMTCTKEDLLCDALEWLTEDGELTSYADGRLLIGEE